MADLFVSYAREDRPTAALLAQRFQSKGYSVWWDRDLGPGIDFYEVVDHEISIATCVFVLWSESSVRSGWVKTEAADALERKILIPIRIEDCRVPLRFRHFDAIELIDWNGDLNSDEYQRLEDHVLRRLGPPSSHRAQLSTRADTDIVAQAARLVRMAIPPGGRLGARKFSEIMKQMPEFVSSGSAREVWLGKGSRLSLLKAIAARDATLRVIENGDALPAIVDAGFLASDATKRLPDAGETSERANATAEEIVEFVTALVRESKQPMPLGAIGTAVRSEFRGHSSLANYFGHKSLKQFLREKAESRGIRISEEGTGFAYLPNDDREIPNSITPD